MRIREIVINNETGLHARPAAMFVQTVSRYKSHVHLQVGVKIMNAKSIISVLSAGISQGTIVKLIIEGEDEEAVEKAILDLAERNFNEE